ncbi:MAG: tyrosine-type recombinase/integrase [Nitrososphaerales archaeon]
MITEGESKAIQPFLDKVYRRSKSETTKHAYLNGAIVFYRWSGKGIEQVIRDIKEGRIDPYKTLDDYLTYLSKSGRSPNTIANYFAIAKKFLRFYGSEFSNEKLKEMIDMPRIHTITQDRIPTVEEMKAILYSTNTRGKAVISMLASSGMRIGELLSLRVKDVDFTTHPTIIRLRAEVTKDRQSRVCFISDESTKFLKQYLGERINNQDSYIFLVRDDNVKDENKPISYWNIDTIFTIAVKKAGIYEKDDHGRDRIHLHVLRKFFFTQMIAVLGREMTEALIGHKQFLDSAYRRFTESQLGEHYLKAMHAVTILDSKPTIQPTDVKLEVLKTLMKQQGLNPDEFLIQKRIEFAREVAPEEQVEILSKGLMNGSGSSKEDKLIGTHELIDYLDSGWSYVDELNNGKVIVRKASF